MVSKYLENFIEQEIATTKHHQLKILGLEEKLQITLDIPELDFPIHLKGKLDRIEEKDGVLRIIDYKSGRVTGPQLEIVDWEESIKDDNYSKAFQLLCYALMYYNSRTVETLEAGILSFKNLKSGVLSFATKEKRTSRTKDRVITHETLAHFEVVLKQLILEICDPDTPFIEKDI